jgi:ribA/ribD-fused uncharacterized protein
MKRWWRNLVMRVLCHVRLLLLWLVIWAQTGAVENARNKEVSGRVFENNESIVVQGHGDVCSNFYPFVFKFGDNEFKSVEQAYHYVRAVSLENNELAAKILAAKHAGEAKILSRGLDRFRLDADEDARNMREMLSAKVDQLPSFREALRASGSARLVHSTCPSENLWGSGLYSADIKSAQKKTLPGENLFGVMLMELRDGHKEEKLCNIRTLFPIKTGIFKAA